MLWKISQYSQESTCVGVSLTKLQEWRPGALLIRDSNSGAFLWILRDFWDTYFADYMRTIASESKAEFVQSVQMAQSVAETTYFFSKYCNYLNGCFRKCNIFKHSSNEVASLKIYKKATFEMNHISLVNQHELLMFH